MSAPGGEGNAVWAMPGSRGREAGKRVEIGATWGSQPWPVRDVVPPCRGGPGGSLEHVHHNVLDGRGTAPDQNPYTSGVSRTITIPATMVSGTPTRI
jgi:hypothetical protein